MSPPTKLAYQYKKTSVIAEGPASHAGAMEIARREFPELRDVPDERIHFNMFVKRHATGSKWAKPMQSRISPGVWKSFFETTAINADQGTTVLFIEVNKPRKRGWTERLGLAKGGKADIKSLEKSEGGAELPTYTKATA